MYCKNCGQQLDDKAVFCPHCGAGTPTPSPVQEDDAPSAGFAVLGFFVPLVGLILYLVFEQEYPQRAKSSGKGALIGFITRVVLVIVAEVLSVLGTLVFLEAFFKLMLETMS